MNKDLERLILAYENVSAGRDTEAEIAMQIFESLIDDASEQHPEVPREMLRKSVIKAHRQWAVKQENKPPAIPPKA